MKKLLTNCIILVVRIYQLVISPLLPTSCHHHPSCSEYGIIQIRKHGLLKGIKMGVIQIWNCR